MSKKDKKIYLNALVISLMLTIILVVSGGRATYEEYINVSASDVCNDIDMDGFVVAESNLPDDWDGIMSPSCPWIISYGDCDNYDIDVYPGAPEIADDGIDQDCDSVDLANYPVPPAEEPAPACNNDGICDAVMGEDNVTCPADCQAVEAEEEVTALVCDYDGVCDESEDVLSCPNDCITEEELILIIKEESAEEPAPVCNYDGVCDEGENEVNCPSDCVAEEEQPTEEPPAEEPVVEEEPPAEEPVVEEEVVEDEVTAPVCGDTVCDEGEDSVDCPDDCPEPSL
jgi:hypothetical protein